MNIFKRENGERGETGLDSLEHGGDSPRKQKNRKEKPTWERGRNRRVAPRSERFHATDEVAGVP